MLEFKIGKIKKEILQADNSEFLSVPVDILSEDGEVLEHRNLGFPLDMPVEEITAEVEAVVLAYEDKLGILERNKKHDEMHATADETIAALNGEDETPEDDQTINAETGEETK